MRFHGIIEQNMRYTVFNFETCKYIHGLGQIGVLGENTCFQNFTKVDLKNVNSGVKIKMISQAYRNREKCYMIAQFL